MLRKLMCASTIVLALAVPAQASAADTTPPTGVALTSPAPNSTVRGTIVATGTAQDDVGVRTADLRVDGVYRAYDNNAPYEWSFDTTVLADGAHSFQVWAYDEAGNGTLSDPVSVIVDNTAPTGVAITSPGQGAVVAGTTPVLATASDSVRVRTVDLRVDGVYVAYDNTAPYSFSLDTTTLSDGYHTLNAWAYDDAGNGTLSASVQVMVQNSAQVDQFPPTGVAITSPADHATVSGSTTVTATAFDDVGIQAVDLHVDGQYRTYDTSEPYTFPLDTTGLADGVHRLRVRAYDASGKETFSEDRIVFVDNVANTTYYVDATNGNDSNDGRSSSRPWKTLSKASSAAYASGDTLLLARGRTWSGSSKLTLSRAGVRVGAYGTGNDPVLTGGCVAMSGSRTVVSNVRTSSCSYAGFSITGDDNIVEYVESSDNVAGVYVQSTGQRNKVLRSAIRNNARMSVLTKGGDDDSGAFGILVHGDDTEIAWNEISGSDAFSYDYGRDGAAVEIYGGSRTWVHHNRTFGNDAFTELGKPSSDAEAADNVYSFNSVVGSTPAGTFLVTRGSADGFGPVLRTVATHNSVHLTGSSSEGFVCFAGCGGAVLKLRNNVISAVRKAGYADGPVDEDYDLLSGPVQGWTVGSHSILGPPNFVSPSTGDLHLASNSAAIDRGVAGLGASVDLDGAAVPYDGNGDGVDVSDFGAFEFRP